MQVRQVLGVLLSVFTFSERGATLFTSLLPLVQRWGCGVSVRWWNRVAFLQVVVKTVTGRSGSMKALHWSGIAVPTAFESLILLYLFLAVSNLIKRKAFNAYMLSISGNMIGLRFRE